MVTLGIKENTTQALDKLLDAVGNWKPTFNESSVLILQEIDINFKQQRIRDKASWTPLSDATREHRAQLKKQGVGGKFSPSRPILRITGALRESFYKDKVTNKELEITSDVDYAVHHQYGTYRMPARPMFDFTDRIQRAIMQIIMNNIWKGVRSRGFR